MRADLRVLFVSAEVAPYSSVGGLSQVSYFLPRALKKLGVDIRIFTPKYGTINESRFPLQMLVESLEVPTGENNPPSPENLICNVKIPKTLKKGDPDVYFLENMEYFEKRANVYNYSDDHIRFGLLSRGALEFVKRNEFIPDLIHINDWHSGYVANFLRSSYQDNAALRKIACLLSIHNLYQGSSFDFDHASEMDYDDGKGPLAGFFSDRYLKQNPLKRGIINADVINTVSETYSREILTEQYAPKLHNLFRELRGKLFGVLNGIDYHELNPATDKIIKKNYSLGTLSDRQVNKIDLQREFNLKPQPAVPILGISGRLDAQKGLDLVMETIGFILQEFEVQLVVVGTGENTYRDFFTQLEKDYPGRVGTHLQFDAALPRKIFAGSDLMLMPSRYEPGGIVAIEAQRYGSVPLVRATGGLADSVIDFDPATATGTGFSFKNFSSMSFLVALVRALETYKNPTIWKGIVRRAMQQDFSWDHAALKYLDLYQRAIEFRKFALLPNPPPAFRQME